jgi:hypothetical protein
MGGRKVNAGGGFSDDILNPCHRESLCPAHKDIIHIPAGSLLAETKPDRCIRLRITINNQNFSPCLGTESGDIYAGGGLSRTTFMVRKSNGWYDIT